MSNLGIGQLAKRAGVAIDTVRYYERNDLLSPAGRLASGYRRYGEAELKRLRFIRRAKALGFHARGHPRTAVVERRTQCRQGQAAAEAKLADVDSRIAELERIRNGLRTLVTACPGHGRAEACPILNALNAEDAHERAIPARRWPCVGLRHRPRLHRSRLRHDGQSRIRHTTRTRRPRTTGSARAGCRTKFVADPAQYLTPRRP